MQLPHDTLKGKQKSPPSPPCPKQKSNGHKALISTMELVMFLVSTYVSRHRLNGFAVIYTKIIIIKCNWVVTRWQWLFYMYTKCEIGY